MKEQMSVATWFALGLSGLNLLASLAILFVVSGHTRASHDMKLQATAIQAQHKTDLLTIQNTISQRLLEFMNQAEKRR